MEQGERCWRLLLAPLLILHLLLLLLILLLQCRLFCCEDRREKVILLRHWRQRRVFNGWQAAHVQEVQANCGCWRRLRC